MENFSVKETQETPAIIFDFNKGELNVTGNSIPENPIKFYGPLIDAIDAYAKAPKAQTSVTFRMNYINTSSSKHILDILRQLETIHRKGSPVTITWIYEHDDHDMLEAGVDYQSVVELDFKLVPIKV